MAPLIMTKKRKISVTLIRETTEKMAPHIMTCASKNRLKRVKYLSLIRRKMAPHIRTKKSNKRKERETRGVENWIMDNDSVTVSLALKALLPSNVRFHILLVISVPLVIDMFASRVSFRASAYRITASWNAPTKLFTWNWKRKIVQC